MKRLDVHIRAFQRALEKRPKVLKAVNVDVSLSVRNRVVDYVVNVLVGEFVVRTKLVRKNLRSFFNVCTNLRIEFATANTLHYLATYSRGFISGFTRQKSEHSGFTNHASFTRFPVLVHENGLLRRCKFHPLQRDRKTFQSS